MMHITAIKILKLGMSTLIRKAAAVVLFIAGFITVDRKFFAVAFQLRSKRGKADDLSKNIKATDEWKGKKRKEPDAFREKELKDIFVNRNERERKRAREKRILCLSSLVFFFFFFFFFCINYPYGVWRLWWDNTKHEGFYFGMDFTCHLSFWIFFFYNPSIQWTISTVYEVMQWCNGWSIIFLILRRKREKERCLHFSKRKIDLKCIDDEGGISFDKNVTCMRMPFECQWRIFNSPIIDGFDQKTKIECVNFLSHRHKNNEQTERSKFGRYPFIVIYMLERHRKKKQRSTGKCFIKRYGAFALLIVRWINT